MPSVCLQVPDDWIPNLNARYVALRYESSQWPPEHSENITRKPRIRESIEGSLITLTCRLFWYLWEEVACSAFLLKSKKILREWQRNGQKLREAEVRTKTAKVCEQKHTSASFFLSLSDWIKDESVACSDWTKESPIMSIFSAASRRIKLINRERGFEGRDIAKGRQQGDQMINGCFFSRCEKLSQSETDLWSSNLLFGFPLDLELQSQHCFFSFVFAVSLSPKKCHSAQHSVVMSVLAYQRSCLFSPLCLFIKNSHWNQGLFLSVRSLAFLLHHVLFACSSDWKKFHDLLLLQLMILVICYKKRDKWFELLIFSSVFCLDAEFLFSDFGCR